MAHRKLNDRNNENTNKKEQHILKLPIIYFPKLEGHRSKCPVIRLWYYWMVLNNPADFTTIGK